MTEYINQIEQNYLWICDSDEKTEAKKAMTDRRLDGFKMPTAASSRGDSWNSTGFHIDGTGSGPTRLVDIKWLSDIDGKEYSQEEILALAKEAIAMKKGIAIGESGLQYR
jgi:hypothetical protein